MAKRGRKPKTAQALTIVPDGQVTIGNMVIRITRELQSKIEGMRERLSEFGRVLASHKADLVEPFMSGLEQWRKETGRNSFVEYVRAIAPDVPGDRDGYRSHPTYQAADYLRRVYQRTTKTGTSAATSNTRSIRVNAVNRLARALKTVFSVIQPALIDQIWTGIATEYGLNDRQLTTLKARVELAQPLLTLPIRRPVAAEVVHEADTAPATVAA